ncbi:MAG: ABC transporter ATP-binding protein [Cyanobacteria bacterium RM1_2_2]|nr:ABC transporter ATP-binding protein [Cyanobacteria bacterium RM1_2_2]
MLSVRHLTKTYPLRIGWEGKRHLIPALQDVSLDIQPGICLGLVGASGAGKSTLGRLVLGLEQPDVGEIWFQGEELGQLASQNWHRVRREMQVVFQDSFSAVNPRLKALEIIGEPLRNYLSLTKTNITERVIQLLETVGLTASDANKYPHQFSGGQLQRITIARAIALNPKLIVLDEPVASLDMSIQAQMLDLLRQLKHQFSLSYLFITHDLTAVAYLADTIAVMQAGRIVESLDCVNLNQLTHPYSQQLIAAQLPTHPRDRNSFTSHLPLSSYEQSSISN